MSSDTCVRERICNIVADDIDTINTKISQLQALIFSAHKILENISSIALSASERPNLEHSIEIVNLQNELTVTLSECIDSLSTKLFNFAEEATAQ